MTWGAVGVLVADDDHDTADSLAMLLRRAGHGVYTAYDGPSALDLARLHRPQAALLDIGLPRLNGYDIAQQLHGERMLLVAVTGFGQESDRQRAREAGFHEFCIKPVDPREIIALLANTEALLGSLRSVEGGAAP